MPTAFHAWKVLPHGPLVQLADNLWWVQGSLPGMSLKRTMTIVRLAEGRLLIHSAIALETTAMGELEALGTPTYLIVPNAYHRLDAPAYKRRYPDLQIYGPRGSRKQIEKVLPLDGTYEQFPADPSLVFEPLDGVDAEWAMLVRSADGVSVVLTDAVFNMDRKRDPLGWLFTTLLGSAPGPRVSRLTKRVLVKDKRAFRRKLEQLAELPELQRLIVAHEKVASGPGAREALRAAAGFL